jgi:hypothetical protein
MAELHLSHDDVRGLALALDELDLPDPQRALLSAIVALGAAAIDQANQSFVVDVDPVPSFHAQFASAFTPERVEPTEAGASSVKVDRMTKLLRIGRD